MSDSTNLSYRVAMPRPNTHYFDVEIRVSNFRNKLEGESLVFAMPVWTPGSYLVREFARNVLDFRAFDAKSSLEIPSLKISKNEWTVPSSSTNEVIVQYKVYAFEHTVDTSYLDDTMGLINGASVFMFVKGLEKEPAILKVKPYQDWKSISCSLDLQDKSQSDYSYFVPSYDILVDSPIELGNQSLYHFVVEGIEHTVSINSKERFPWDRLVSDIKSIVESTIPIFGEIPYEKYTFLIDISANEGAGGLEHLSSTHCIAPYFRLFPEQEYRQILSLFSHEFFHAWNVKRMRPKGLGPFDYSAEVYTKSLWISEGITSYYDDLILRRANLFTIPEYLDSFALNLDLMISLPGSRWESAEESSFDTWIRHYRSNENTPNVHSSYYNQGAVIGWMIDTEIARMTDGSKRLDDVMRGVYERTYKKHNSGFTDNEFEAECNVVAGSSISEDIFEKRVRGREAIDPQKYLGYYGLELHPKKERESSKGYLGVKMRSDGGRSIVSSVLFDTPAESGGIASGDEIIAVDQLRIDLSKLSFIIANKFEGEKIDLIINRDGQIRGAQVTVGKRPVFEHRIQKKETASEQQKKMFRLWLCGNWDDELQYMEYSQSPIRKHALDYI